MNNHGFKKTLEIRTMEYAVNVILFLKSFPYSMIDSVILKQVLRSATSIGANYREANRAESKNDFIHKVGIVEKEVSETMYWFGIMELTWNFTQKQQDNFIRLKTETSELLAIFSTISRKSKL
ncbi:MAG: four helix bundle protein [Victivallaceae bacterium]